jgi:hypothetical protein
MVSRARDSFELTGLRAEPHAIETHSPRAKEPDWGDYRFSVRDAAGAVVWSAGFDSSVAGADAATIGQVSVRMPMPLRPTRAVVERRRPANLFLECWSETVDPGSGASRQHGPAVRVETLLSNGPPHSKLDIAIVGDAYRESEQAKFMRDATRAAGYLFSVQPFKRRMGDFNVHALFAASADSRVTDPYLGVRSNSLLACSYGSGEAERTLFVRNNRTLRDVAATVPYDMLLVIANSRRYGGSAIFGGPAVVAIDSAAARYLVLHEFAHVIGGLADEYYVPLADGPVFPGNVEPWNPNVTMSVSSKKWPHAAIGATPWKKNEYDSFFAAYAKRYFSLRSAHAAESRIDDLMRAGAVRAAALLRKNNAHEVGLFEGANGYSKGIFRSEVDCIMFSYQTEFFCAACTAAIERMIDARSS